MKPTTLILTVFVLILLSGCALQRTSMTQDEPEQKYKPASTAETVKQKAEPAQPAYQEVETVSIRVLMIIAPNDFRDEEYFEPKDIFETRGFEVVTASKVVDEARSKAGVNVPIDVDISDVDVSEYDAIVFVGGPGASTYMKDETAFQIAKDADAQNKVVAAICLAPSILANAGVLKDHKATAYLSEKQNINLKSKGFTNDLVTIDGNIVTGNGPLASKEFGNAVADLLL